ncbi:hypothetical protein AB0J72_31725 [Dactylosporangium sp. NPDC049742]|uniref:hypothetical protein n=1 Tax=Dactylosporangium sp. NPDC049742 TaxID=3154737 RepID=UPI00343A3870
MKLHRIGLALSSAVLAGVGAVGVPAVAGAQPSPAAPGGGTETVAPSPESTACAQGHRHAGMLRNVEHGEGVVQTKQGQVNVAMQNGTLTAVSASAVTVKSADGWTRTWTMGDNLRVVEHRHTLQPGALTTGTNITIAGTTSGTGTGTGTSEKYTARIIRLHEHTGMQPSPGATPAPSGM